MRVAYLVDRHPTKLIYRVCSLHQGTARKASFRVAQNYIVATPVEVHAAILQRSCHLQLAQDWGPCLCWQLIALR